MDGRGLLWQATIRVGCKGGECLGGSRQAWRLNGMEGS